MPSTGNNKYAPAAWASRDFDFDLPSGDVVLLRKIGPTDLLKWGIQDKLDFVTTVVVDKHTKNGRRSAVEMAKAQRAAQAGEITEDDAKFLAEMAADPDKLVRFEEILDVMLVQGVVQPKMELSPEDDSKRIQGHFYTDAVPFDDKMAIFNKLMEGVQAARQFRGGSEGDVGTVAPKPGVRSTPQRATRASRKRTTG